MSQALSRTKLAASLIDYIKSNDYSQAQAQKIAAYLIATKRTKELDSLKRDMMKYRASNDTLEITVTSAHKLDGETLERLKKLLPAKKYVVNEVVKPQVLGGVLIEAHDTQLDLTVKSQIQKLRSFDK